MTVYFIQAGDNGPVKIGVTRAPVEDRLTELQAGNHLPLRVIRAIAGDVHVERHFHARFAGRRILREWFEFDPAMLTEEPGAIFRSPMEFVRRHVFRMCQCDFSKVSGADQTVISRWENGKGHPTPQHKQRIRDAALARGAAWSDSWFTCAPKAEEVGAAA